MNNYYILQLNPQAEFDWERRTLQNPLTGERPDLIAGDRPSGKQSSGFLFD